MRNLVMFGMAFAVTSAVSVGEDLKSGPQAGDRLGAFYVTKCAGAEKDGVREGKSLCYRCKNGSKPQVVIFTRSIDPQVVEFVKQLDKAINKNADAKLTGFVNVLADDRDDASDAARKLATTSEATQVPFVVPNEFENGPDNYGISPKAQVTVILADQVNVKANFAVSDVKELKTKEIIADIKKIL
ncbi:MAG: hypothetical protein MK110_06075 [Fuerstiella sp.]|nr:hypothetical protein [Fuerstiella sp.]